MLAREFLRKWNDNVDQVVDAATQSLRTHLEQQRHLVAALAAMQGVAIPTASSQADQLIATARAFAQRLLDAAHPIRVKQTDVSKAGARALAAMRPASKGNSALADCVIVEAVLRFARKRRQGKAPAVFLSSNTKDYYVGGSLDQASAAEFSDVGITFAPTWVRARYALENR